MNAEVKNASRLFEKKRREPAKALMAEINTKVSFVVSYDPGGSTVRKNKMQLPPLSLSTLDGAILQCMLSPCKK